MQRTHLLGMRRSMVSIVALMAMVGSMFMVTMEPARAVAPGSHGDRVVTATAPAPWTPHVLDGYVRTIAEVGNVVLAGGNFSTVRQYNSQTELSRQNIVAFQKGTGQILSGFDPAMNGEVFEIIPTGDGQTVWVVGGFSSWNGQGISRVAKVNVNTGQRVAAFNPPGFNGRIHDVAFRNNRLYVMGRFTTVAGQPHTLVAALNPTTGALIPDVKIDIAVPRPDRADGFLTVVSGDVTPDGSKMVIIGNFTQIAGQPRYQIGMLDLTTNPISVANWRTTEYDDPCSRSFDTYMRDVEISPDGSHFIVVTTGAFNGGQPSGTLCDSAARWDFSRTGEGLQPTWINYTGGDTLLSTAVTESVAYLGGHQRWQNNPFCSDCDGRGGVDREGIAAVDAVSGATISWNPGRNRGVGVYGMKAVNDGLWIGSDTERIGRWHLRPRLAFMPLASGWDMPAEYTGSLPGAVYSLGRDSGSAEQVHQLVRREFTGTVASNPQITPSSGSGVTWGNVRGAFMVDGKLYYGWEEGGNRTFRVAAFNGQSLGAPTIIDLNGLDDNRPTNGSMGSSTINARSPRNITNFAGFDLPNLTGMFYDAEAGRLYFNTTVVTSSSTGSGGPTEVRLSWRQFSTESDIVGAVRHNGPTSAQAGVNWTDVRSMFLADGHLYVATTNGNLTRYVWQSNVGTPDSGTPVPGSGVVVSGPGVDDQDWRSRDAFVFVGEGETPPNTPPTASFEFSCDGATCDFDGSGSTDPGGAIASFAWDFDDDTAPGAGESISHVYQASGTYNVSLTVTDGEGATDTIVLPVSVTVPNLPPTASFTYTCSGLACAFDASDSSDPTGDPLTFTWNFGDGDTANGPIVSHTYPGGGGTFNVTLKVSDGVSSPEASQEITVVDPSVTVDAKFRAVAESNMHSVAPRVTVPSSVQAGDVLVMIASASNHERDMTGPAGWTSLGSESNATATVRTQAWWKVATAADVGSSVGPSLPSQTKVALQVVAYSDAEGVSASEVDIDIVSGTVRTTPTVAVAKAGSVLVSYWADKSAASSGWLLPAGVSERSQTTGTGGGQMAAALADSGPLAAGSAGGQIATTTAAANRRGITWSIVIAPAD